MKICFVAPRAYPYLSSDGRVNYAGGAEIQQFQIGLGLRDIGMDISYIVWDHGQPDAMISNGFRLYKTFKENEGIFGLRFLYPRFWKIWSALIRANADIYYCRTAGILPALLALFCQRYRRKFIFAVGSDNDVIPEASPGGNSRDNFLYRLGIRRAAVIIVQSERQQRLLWDNFGLRGVMIRNFLLDGTPLNSADREVILWVAMVRQLKQPFRFIRLAEQFPHERFVMIGGPDSHDPFLYEQVEEQCSKLVNISFLGFQPSQKTDLYFAKAKIFVNTSLYEGFPNTFLQAWRRGVPVISFVDPDAIIGKHNLGAAVTTEKELAEAINEFLIGRMPDSVHIKEYFQCNHSSGVIYQYRDLLNKLCL